MSGARLFPIDLHLAAAASLGVAVFCAVIIVLDELRFPQRMWIMNLVWPLTVLFGSVIWLWMYYRWGRAKQAPTDRPIWVAIFAGASHCGAGCTLGDLIGEWLAFALPGVAVWFGWHSLFDDKTFAVWILDGLLAVLLGIGFQYFTIAPLRNLAPAAGLVEAAKADIASISAWQIGMYGAMGLIQFGWLRPHFGQVAPVASVEFWFSMQMAMLAGFATSFPVNWLLIRSGIKERM